MFNGGKTARVTNSLALIVIHRSVYCTYSIEILFCLNDVLFHLVCILLQLVNQAGQIRVSYSEVK